MRKLSRNVIVLGLVSLLNDASSEIVYPLLPLFLTGPLGASASLVGLIEGVTESASSLLKLPAGWWSDRLGRRKELVLAGYGLATLVRPLLALATSAWQVLGLRMIDRVGKGVRTGPRDALLADSTAPETRGMAGRANCWASGQSFWSAQADGPTHHIEAVWLGVPLKFIPSTVEKPGRNGWPVANCPVA